MLQDTYRHASSWVRWKEGDSFDSTRIGGWSGPISPITLGNAKFKMPMANKRITKNLVAITSCRLVLERLGRYRHCSCKKHHLKDDTFPMAPHSGLGFVDIFRTGGVSTATGGPHHRVLLLRTILGDNGPSPGDKSNGEDVKNYHIY